MQNPTRSLRRFTTDQLIAETQRRGLMDEQGNFTAAGHAALTNTD